MTGPAATTDPTDSPDTPDLAPETDITADFDPLFAQVLQERGYIADADKITFAEVKEITELDVAGGLTVLKGIEYFESLTELDCGWNQLTALDVSKNTALTYMSCYGNQLTALDVSNNTALTYLNCEDNQLTALDIRNNTALVYLYCRNNPGNGMVFPVTAWFDNSAIPSDFPTVWVYNGATITVDYRKAE